MSNYRSRYAQDMKPREEDEEHKNRILHHWPITVVKRRRLIDVVDDSVRFIRRPSLKVNNNRSNRGDEARVVIIPGEIHPLHTYGGGNTTTNVGVQQLLQTPPPPPPPPPFHSRPEPPPNSSSPPPPQQRQLERQATPPEVPSQQQRTNGGSQSCKHDCQSLM